MPQEITTDRYHIQWQDIPPRGNHLRELKLTINGVGGAGRLVQVEDHTSDMPGYAWYASWLSLDLDQLCKTRRCPSYQQAIERMMAHETMQHLVACYPLLD